MLIIGCDYHPGFQQIAFVDTETGEFGERRLTHREEAEQFYDTLRERSVRVGMEASGHARWFERLLRDLQFELWIGDAAEIRTKRLRKQKTDRQDADGTASITSTPDGADIFIDSVGHGHTPALLKLRPGNHRVQLVLQGYKDSLIDVEVKADSIVNVTGKLER